jgi:hypothetical protein
MISVATDAEGKRARIEIKKAVPYSIKSVRKRVLFEEFQVFAYPIMIEDHLIIYRNGYHIHKDLPGIGGGMFFIYEKVDKEWVKILLLNTWHSS